MRYKNNKTGAIVDSASIVKGENWELAEPIEPDEDLDQKELDESDKDADLQEPNEDADLEEDEELAKLDEELEKLDELEDEVDLHDLTKAQLSEMLDDKGIKYKAQDNKDELIRLLTEE